MYSVSQNKGSPNKKNIKKRLSLFMDTNFLHDINLCNVNYH